MLLKDFSYAAQQYSAISSKTADWPEDAATRGFRACTSGRIVPGCFPGQSHFVTPNRSRSARSESFVYGTFISIGEPRVVHLEQGVARVEDDGA